MQVITTDEMLYLTKRIGLENCIKKGHIVPENRYEISGDKEMGRTGAPEKGRKNKESNVSDQDQIVTDMWVESQFI